MSSVLLTPVILSSERQRLYSWALALGIFTVGYNVLEGLVSTYFGIADETLALFGFGADSFIEVLSGAGIIHLILRIRRNDNRVRDEFERTALRITGVAFYVLCGGLILSSAANVYTGHVPDSTLWGVVISLVSIAVMWALMAGKIYVGKRVESAPILADANCTRACIYMSFVLLGASLLYEFTGFAYADVIGTLGLVWFAWKEGRECFHKARSNAVCGCGDKECH